MYCGDRDILKSPARNYLTKKVDPFMKRESHYVKDHHEGIIPRQLLDAVQEQLKKRGRQECLSQAQERSSSLFQPYYLCLLWPAISQMLVEEPAWGNDTHVEVQWAI